MKLNTALSLLLVLGAVLGTSGAGMSAVASVHAEASCSPARVQYAPYPGGDERLANLPWVRGKPLSVGLIGLLWYWPEDWRKQRVRPARIFTGGVAPAGYSTKILWTFVARSAANGGGTRLVVRGRRLDGSGTVTAEFAAITFAGQRGAPSFASIIDVPQPGCWRLELSTGTLRASVVFLAVGQTG